MAQKISELYLAVGDIKPQKDLSEEERRIQKQIQDEDGSLLVVITSDPDLIAEYQTKLGERFLPLRPDSERLSVLGEFKGRDMKVNPSVKLLPFDKSLLGGGFYQFYEWARMVQRALGLPERVLETIREMQTERVLETVKYPVFQDLFLRFLT